MKMNMKKKFAPLVGFGLALTPIFAFAQATCGSAQGGTIESILCEISNILNTIIPVIIVLGVVYFVWGVVSYVISSEEEAKKAGRDRMIFGIIGLVVIVSMWGLVAVVTKTFGLNSSGPIQVNVPCITGTPGC